MRQLRTQAIILNRTDYGEADRILSFLTPDHGKLKAIAKGVRKSKSKLAGGIELFSVSDISFIPGRKEISTIVSTRLVKHYGNIVKDLDRTNSAYDAIKKLDKATEDSPEPDYFCLLQDAFEALNEISIPLELINIWFDSQLLRLAGHTPNLRTDGDGQKLKPNDVFDFDFDTMTFNASTQGSFTSDHIKFLRLIFSNNQPIKLAKVNGHQAFVQMCAPLIRSILQTYIRI